jgi:hypothetical protein
MTARVASSTNIAWWHRFSALITQHSDARHKAVAAFGEIGLSFPPVSWEQAWAHVTSMARGALDVVREEVHVGLP